MKIKQEQHLSNLLHLQKQVQQDAESFQVLSDEQLNFKPSSDSWSILECLEHLNRYGLFYLPEIKRVLTQATYTQAEYFKSGILGSYFSKSMLPKEKLNKMKTFKEMNPNGSKLERSVLNEFIRQQEELQRLLLEATKTNLIKVKTAISITKLIRLRLGDTFQFYINHQIRHIKQAQRVLAMQK